MRGKVAWTTLGMTKTGTDRTGLPHSLQGDIVGELGKLALPLGGRTNEEAARTGSVSATVGEDAQLLRGTLDETVYGSGCTGAPHKVSLRLGGMFTEEETGTGVVPTKMRGATVGEQSKVTVLLERSTADENRTGCIGIPHTTRSAVMGEHCNVALLLGDTRESEGTCCCAALGQSAATLVGGFFELLTMLLWLWAAAAIWPQERKPLRECPPWMLCLAIIGGDPGGPTSGLKVAASGCVEDAGDIRG